MSMTTSVSEAHCAKDLGSLILVLNNQWESELKQSFQLKSENKEPQMPDIILWPSFLSLHTYPSCFASPNLPNICDGDSLLQLKDLFLDILFHADKCSHPAYLCTFYQVLMVGSRVMEHYALAKMFTKLLIKNTSKFCWFITGWIKVTSSIISSPTYRDFCLLHLNFMWQLLGLIFTSHENTKNDVLSYNNYQMIGQFCLFVCDIIRIFTDRTSCELDFKLDRETNWMMVLLVSDMFLWLLTDEEEGEQYRASLLQPSGFSQNFQSQQLSYFAMLIKACTQLLQWMVRFLSSSDPASRKEVKKFRKTAPSWFLSKFSSLFEDKSPFLQCFVPISPSQKLFFQQNGTIHYFLCKFLRLVFLFFGIMSQETDQFALQNASNRTLVESLAFYFVSLVIRFQILFFSQDHMDSCFMFLQVYTNLSKYSLEAQSLSCNWTTNPTIHVKFQIDSRKFVFEEMNLMVLKGTDLCSNPDCVDNHQAKVKGRKPDSQVSSDAVHAAPLTLKTPRLSVLQASDWLPAESKEQVVFQNCSLCLITSYCSKGCQKAHWTLHKTMCKKTKCVLDAYFASTSSTSLPQNSQCSLSSKSS